MLFGGKRRSRHQAMGGGEQIFFKEVQNIRDKVNHQMQNPKINSLIETVRDVINGQNNKEVESGIEADKKLNEDVEK